MSSLNKVMLIGHLGKDPEIRHTSGGTSVANFSLATNEKWKDKEGVQQERTEWHNIVAWDKLADIMGKYLFKGSQVYLEGRIQTRKWQDRDNNDRYTTEIVCANMVMLGGKRDEAKPQNNEPRNCGDSSPDITDDEIPF